MLKLLSRRRNYSDADPIRFYCDNPSPDNTLRCVDELGHLGWCINGDTSWRDEVWNVDHWANTEEAPPVESEPTMSATEWVRLKSELKPEPEPQDTPNDRDPLSAAWLRGYHRDRNPAAAAPAVKPSYMPSGLRTMPAPDGIGTRILNTPMPDEPYEEKAGTTWAAVWRWAAATVVVIVGMSIFIRMDNAALKAQSEPPLNAAHSKVKKYETLNECVMDNPKRAVVDCKAHTTGINTARRTLFVKLTAGPNGARWLTEQYCLEENPQAQRCAKEPPESPSDYSKNRAGWVVVE